MVVKPQPTSGMVFNIVQIIEQILIQQPIPNGTIVTLNISILLRFARLNVFNPDAFLCGPSLEFMTGSFAGEGEILR